MIQGTKEKTNNVKALSGGRNNNTSHPIQQYLNSICRLGGIVDTQNIESEQNKP